MLLVEFMTGTPLLAVMSKSESSTVCVKRGRPVSVAPAHTVTDGFPRPSLFFILPAVSSEPSIAAEAEV